MLVLTRKADEKIRIGDDIVITVVRANGPVRLGIEAPEDVLVVRDELSSFHPGTRVGSYDVRLLQGQRPQVHAEKLSRKVAEKTACDLALQHPGGYIDITKRTGDLVEVMSYVSWDVELRLVRFTSVSGEVRFLRKEPNGWVEA